MEPGNPIHFVTSGLHFGKNNLLQNTVPVKKNNCGYKTTTTTTITTNYLLELLNDMHTVDGTTHEKKSLIIISDHLFPVKSSSHDSDPMTVSMVTSTPSPKGTVVCPVMSEMMSGKYSSSVTLATDLYQNMPIEPMSLHFC